MVVFCACALEPHLCKCNKHTADGKRPGKCDQQVDSAGVTCWCCREQEPVRTGAARTGRPKKEEAQRNAQSTPKTATPSSSDRPTKARQAAADTPKAQRVAQGRVKAVKPSSSRQAAEETPKAQRIPQGKVKAVTPSSAVRTKKKPREEAEPEPERAGCPPWCEIMQVPGPRLPPEDGPPSPVPPEAGPPQDAPVPQVLYPRAPPDDGPPPEPEPPQGDDPVQPPSPPSPPDPPSPPPATACVVVGYVAFERALPVQLCGAVTMGTPLERKQFDRDVPHRTHKQAGVTLLFVVRTSSGVVRTCFRVVRTFFFGLVRTFLRLNY